MTREGVYLDIVNFDNKTISVYSFKWDLAVPENIQTSKRKRGHGVKTYFVAVQVTPLPENQFVKKVEDASIYFWINDEAPEKVRERVDAYLLRNNWKLDVIEKEAVEVTAADFAENEDGMMGFWKAKQTGFAARVIAKQKSDQD